MRLPLLSAAACLVAAAVAVVPDQKLLLTPSRPAIIASHPATDADAPPANIPLVIWHGLGDSYDSDGQRSVAKLYQRLFPGASVHHISLAGDDGGADSRASWFGSVRDQTRQVCDELSRDAVIGQAEAVNALGFSQGGQFLRGLIQTCPQLRVRSLVTFGSQHNGIAKYQVCKPGDVLCRWLSGLARANTWSEWTQSHVVPAQYFRDPDAIDDYLTSTSWLAEANNELPLKNTTFAANLARLARFAMYVFADDTVVFPPVSGWFGEYNATSNATTPLRERALYREDWLGLRRLDNRQALWFGTAPGGHMQLSDEVLTAAFVQHMSPGVGVASQAHSSADEAVSSSLERSGGSSTASDHDAL